MAKTYVFNDVPIGSVRSAATSALAETMIQLLESEQTLWDPAADWNNCSNIELIAGQVALVNLLEEIVDPYYTDEFVVAGRSVRLMVRALDDLAGAVLEETCRVADQDCTEDWFGYETWSSKKLDEHHRIQQLNALEWHVRAVHNMLVRVSRTVLYDDDDYSWFEDSVPDQ